MKIKLENLKNKCQIKNSLDLVIDSALTTPKFNFDICIRHPIKEKEFISVPKQVIRITKSYPEFIRSGNLSTLNNENSNSENTDINNKLNETSEENSIKEKINKDNFKKENNDDNREEKNKINLDDFENNEKNEKKLLESEFKKEDIEDPENLDNLISLKVMEILIAKMDLQIKKIEGRTPSKIRMKFLSLKCRYNTMKSQIEDGDITLQNYINVLTEQIAKDKKLAEYFKQEEQKGKFLLVNEKLQIMIKEIEEGKSHL